MKDDEQLAYNIEENVPWPPEILEREIRICKNMLSHPLPEDIDTKKQLKYDPKKLKIVNLPFNENPKTS